MCIRHGLVEEPRVLQSIPLPLVDSNRVPSRRQLGIASRKHLRTRLHDLQVQTARKAIARIIR
jgi:hypothetical protein